MNDEDKLAADQTHNAAADDRFDLLTPGLPPLRKLDEPAPAIPASISPVSLLFRSLKI